MNIRSAAERASGQRTGSAVSEAMREASRRNGSKSRGPKTSGGKARSAQNSLRHGLSRPAACDPILAKQIAALALAIAGPQPGPERLDLAFQIAAAEIEILRVRRARAETLSALLEDESALRRAVALERYEARAWKQREFAARRFDAAYPAYGGMAIAAAQGAGLKPAPTDLRYKGFRRTSPRYPRLFRAWFRPLEAVLAEQARRAAAARKSQTNPTQLVRMPLEFNAEGSFGAARNGITKRTQAIRKSQTNLAPLASIALEPNGEGRGCDRITKRTQAACPARVLRCDRIPVARGEQRSEPRDLSSQRSIPRTAALAALRYGPARIYLRCHGPPQRFPSPGLRSRNHPRTRFKAVSRIIDRVIKAPIPFSGEGSPRTYARAHQRHPAEMVLDQGERAAIAVAAAVNADLILIDDRAGAAVAYRRGFTVTGTLGVLDLGTRRGLIDLARALERLRATNFRYRPEIMDALLAQHSGEKKTAPDT